MTPEAVWRVMVDAAERVPDTEFVDRDDWVQLRTPSSPYAHANRVFRARFEAAEADERIAVIVADHRARGAGLSWVVDASSRPADLSARLEAAGVARLAETRGMARAIEHGETPPPSVGVRIVAATRADAGLIGELAKQAWSNVGDGRSVVEWVERVFDRNDRNVEFTLAFLDDEPAGYAVLRVLRPAAYMQGACVLPSARGRGLYTALTHVRLARLHALGIPHAVMWANVSTSAPIAARLGFEHITTAIFHELASSPPTR